MTSYIPQYIAYVSVLAVPNLQYLRLNLTTHLLLQQIENLGHLRLDMAVSENFNQMVGRLACLKTGVLSLVLGEIWMKFYVSR